MGKPLAFVIEDDEQLATIFGTALEAAGYNVEVITDGALALERLVAVVPDIVILDLNLPYVSGVDIFNQIRADEHLANTRIIVASANARAAEELDGEADLVLIKPVSYHQLRQLAARFHPGK